MPFMTKEEIHSEADRLGIDLDGLSWPQQQKVVMDAQMEEKRMLRKDEPYSHRSFTPNSDQVVISRKELEELIKAASCATSAEAAYADEEVEDDEDLSWFAGDDVPAPVAWTPQSSVEAPHDVDHIEEEAPDPMADMRGKTVVIAPEMAQTATQLFGYDEDLGEEIAVEEEHYDVRNAVNFTRDMVTGTYRIKGKTGRRVTAQTAMPKEGCGITFRPDKDLVPVVTFQGRSGYLWTHHRLPNIKDLLKQSGYYEQYKSRFQDDPAIWHSAGKLLCCDIAMTEQIFRDIEADAKRKIIEREQQRKFLDGNGS